MQIVSIKIRNFRCIKTSEIFPDRHNVLLGPNNSGKTTVLEALNLLLNPEMSFRINAIDENDFFQRSYQSDEAHENAQEKENQNTQETEETVSDETTGNPTIYIEAVLSELSTEDETKFNDVLVPWDSENESVIEETDEGTDPFVNAQTAIRVFFEGWYNEEEDEFDFGTYFLQSSDMARDDCKRFNRDHKRYVGFLIYRDFRALTRPITLDPSNLFARLIQSQLVTPKHFEDVLSAVKGSLDPINTEGDFSEILQTYKSEIEKYLPLSEDESSISFDLTDRTRYQVKASSQLHIDKEGSYIPIQKMGAGTRSLAILSILTLIMRKRGRGILALEEPETFLFPHAQRRVIDECLNLADQTFITTHSPYVLERVPAEGVGRVDLNSDNELKWSPISTNNVKQLNLYTNRLKQVHCEALVGRGVIIVEGDSDRCWISGVSRILNNNTWNGRAQEALELQGVSIVSADTNGDILKLGDFFDEAGLKEVCVFDRIDDMPFVEKVTQKPFPSIFLKYTGLEDLLVEEIPIELLKTFLTSASHCKNPLKSATGVAAMKDKQVRDASLKMLKDNKGSISMHEWFISLLDMNSVPATLANIVDIVTQYMAGSFNFTCSSII
ncbi:ATP-binding protein [bacterium]|nr:ATP-binding protein [bacterium]